MQIVFLSTRTGKACYALLLGLALIILIPAAARAHLAELSAAVILESVPTAVEPRIFLPQITTSRDRSNNRAPSARDDVATVREDSVATIEALANDQDPDGDPIVVANNGRSSHGVVTRVNNNSAFFYAPAANYTGADSFTYHVTDGDLASNSVTVNITIVPVNDPPVALPDTKETVEDKTLLIPARELVLNDVAGPPDESVQTLHLTGVTETSETHGTVSLGGGSVIYNPELDYFGDASFAYTICDNGTTGGGSDPKCAPGTVTVNVAPLNDPPSFSKGADQQVVEDAGAQTVPGWATAMLAGPANEANQTFSFRVSWDNPGLFAVKPTITSDGTLRYTPAPNSYGSATVSVFLRDNGGTGNGGVPDSATHTFVIAVTPVNDAAAAFDDAKATLEDTLLVFSAGDLAANDSPGPSNEDDQILHVTAVAETGETHGAAVLSGGTVYYQPARDYNGPASFLYTVCDNGRTNGLPAPRCATATVTVNVDVVNDQPSFTRGPDQTVTEDAGAQTVPGWASAMTVGPANEASQSFSFRVSSNNISLFTVVPSIGGDGTLRYTPTPNAHGSATVSVFLRDNGGMGNGGVQDSAVHTFVVTVTPVNDAITALPDWKEAVEDTPIRFSAGDLTANDSPGPSNENDQSLEVTEVTPIGETHGTVNLINGTVRYEPAPDYFGTASFRYTVCDDGSTNGVPAESCTTASVTINVDSVNDLPSFTKGADQTVAKGAGAQTVPGWATALSAGPANEASQTLEFNATTDNDPIFAVKPSITADGTLRYTPSTVSTGEATITVRLRDSGGAFSETQTFVITVTDG